MSCRILLAKDRSPWGGWDAQLVDYPDFQALADDDEIHWCNHMRCYADETYMPRAREFEELCAERRWDGVIEIQPFTEKMREDCARAANKSHGGIDNRGEVE